MICPLMSRPRHSADPRPQTGTFIDCVECRCPSWRGYCVYLKQQRPPDLPRPDAKGMTAPDCPKCGGTRQLEWREGQPHTYDDHGLFAVCYRCQFTECVQALDAQTEASDA